ncbi:MAG: Ppx/GppA family phosphatase [Campylobacterales bacterium]|nr:Ppx/GppA family phosphatase [Campylobacterales bacterium]
MAKITTIIDIGSNSMRMVVFKKTSRYGFHLINESKLKVKISEGCYENGGNLQPLPMQRAFGALKSFLNIAQNLKSRKILCVATSALRDAPNKKEFLNKVSRELKLNIKIIDGNKEAYYGGVAALNLLAANNFSTIDIGGGSTEFAMVQNNEIIDTVSLNIGTVRIQELFFNKNDLDGAKKYIYDQIESFKDIFDKNFHLFENMVGLGGTARALSRCVILQKKHPIDVLHGFEYDTTLGHELFDKIISTQNPKKLKSLGVRKDRFDTIATGTFIFKTILEYFQTKKIITSGVGVREGVYLSDLLRNNQHKFPQNFNPSVRSLLDRYVDDHTQSAYLGANAKAIFNTLMPLHNLDEKYRSILVVASKLQLIGQSLNFYSTQDNSFWYILNGLNYGYTHEDKILISIVAKYTGRSLPKDEDIAQFKKMLPDTRTINWLNFMMTLNIYLNTEYSKIKYNYQLDSHTLKISSQSENYLIKNDIFKIEAPDGVIVELD